MRDSIMETRDLHWANGRTNVGSAHWWPVAGRIDRTLTGADVEITTPDVQSSPISVHPGSRKAPELAVREARQRPPP